MKDNFSMYTYFYLKQTLLGTELLMEWCCNWRKLSFLWRHPYDVAKLSSLKNCKVVIFVFVWLVFYQILANSSKILGSMIFFGPLFRDVKVLSLSDVIDRNWIFGEEAHVNFEDLAELIWFSADLIYEFLFLFFYEI